MDEEDEVRQLAGMFVQLGAEQEQAEVMARQLSKRATQLAEQRGISRLEALRELLALVRSGRSGETYSPEKPKEGE